jgi:hypothetical protein
LGVAGSDYELSFVSFEKANLKLIFGYVQNHHSYPDSATPIKIPLHNDRIKLVV